MQQFNPLPVPVGLAVAQACSDLAPSSLYVFGLVGALGFLTARSSVGGLDFYIFSHK